MLLTCMEYIMDISDKELINSPPPPLSSQGGLTPGTNSKKTNKDT